MPLATAHRILPQIDGATMREHFIERDGVTLYAREDGAIGEGVPTLVLLNSLGSELSLWDQVVDLLPEGLRVVRMDKRGHGRSTCPDGPYSMGALISDAEAVCDHLNVRDAAFVGLSIGGMIAQGLAVKRLDLMRVLVLSNTAAKIGNPAFWQDRIDAVRKNGLETMADAILDRWVSKAFRKTPAVEPLRHMLAGTPTEGYVGCCAAIAGTDFYTPTSGLRLPTLGISGSEDATTPADLVRETIDLIPGSQFQLMRRTGHLPCYEAPAAFTDVLVTFLKQTGHIE